MSVQPVLFLLVCYCLECVLSEVVDIRQFQGSALFQRNVVWGVGHLGQLGCVCLCCRVRPDCCYSGAVVGPLLIGYLGPIVKVLDHHGQEAIRRLRLPQCNNVTMSCCSLSLRYLACKHFSSNSVSISVPLATNPYIFLTEIIMPVYPCTHSGSYVVCYISVASSGH